MLLQALNYKKLNSWLYLYKSIVYVIIIIFDFYYYLHECEYQ
jgi:hypothetical protein